MDCVKRFGFQILLFSGLHFPIPSEKVADSPSCQRGSAFLYPLPELTRATSFPPDLSTDSFLYERQPLSLSQEWREQDDWHALPPEAVSRAPDSVNCFVDPRWIWNRVTAQAEQENKLFRWKRVSTDKDDNLFRCGELWSGELNSNFATWIHFFLPEQHLSWSLHSSFISQRLEKKGHSREDVFIRSYSFYLHVKQSSDTYASSSWTKFKERKSMRNERELVAVKPCVKRAPSSQKFGRRAGYPAKKREEESPSRPLAPSINFFYRPLIHMAAW